MESTNKFELRRDYSTYDPPVANGPRVAVKRRASSLRQPCKVLDVLRIYVAARDFITMSARLKALKTFE